MKICHAATLQVQSIFQNLITSYEFQPWGNWGKLHSMIYSCLCDPLLPLCVCSLVCNSLQPHGLQPTRFHCQWNFPGMNSVVGCHFLLQGIFSTQGLNLCLLHWQAGILPLSHQGNPHIYKTQSINKLKDWWGMEYTHNFQMLLFTH